ncbi:hypothetical protein WR25_02427 isoform G [Diploscapter pachys]|nr:hypothetical protein WR25_02427 isoform B [Diploscapter pachys]PAV74432.1 hypothetical protein WR25_02427 isoform C [Diploscapter pachys]PAV74433.1 hypothetical protein WR25_02427 isoform D [Diploscapter pachys]PAV74436.1 hypothetical protein WR25_02427 isoform G [Diploscapter pachys]
MSLVQHRAGLNVKEKTEIKIKRRSRAAELQANGEPSERRKRLSMEEIIARAAAHLADDDSDDSDDDRHRATPEDPSVPEPPLRDDSFDLTTLPHSNTPNLDQARLPTTSTPLASDHPQPKTPMMNNGLNPVTPITASQNRQPPAARPSIVETIEEEKDEGNEDSNFSDEPLIVKKNSRKSDDEQEDTPFDFTIEDSNDFDNFTLVKQKSPSVVAETIAEEEEKENEQEQEEDDDFDMPFTVTEKRDYSKEAANEQNESQKETQQKVQATQNQDWTKKMNQPSGSGVKEDGGKCCNGHSEENNSKEADEKGVDEEVVATEKVVNAFLFYHNYGQQQMLRTLGHMRKLPNAHKELLKPPISSHLNSVRNCIEANSKFLKMMVNYSAGMFGDEVGKALKIRQSRLPDETYMSKVLSTLRQIAREWSVEGEEERQATYAPVMDDLIQAFPDEDTRHLVRVFVPGAGLGRLAWELIQKGFSVMGNEYSMFMLMASCFVLNACKEANQFTIYPYIFDKNNSWSYADQIRAVKFPDNCPKMNEDTKNSFSMCAGNFLEIAQKEANSFNAIVTAWFIDTANNVIEYIETIYSCLISGGVWINVGPLTYHWADMNDEMSIELPYEEIIRIVKHTGFQIVKEDRKTSNYCPNTRSMLSNVYNCAYFVAVKPTPETSNR